MGITYFFKNSEGKINQGTSSQEILNTVNIEDTNTLGDLNNHLFMQLEKLSEDDLKGEELREEMTVNEVYFCRKKQELVTKAGKPYFSFR